MKKRVGNDIKMTWTILRSGEAEVFDNATNIKIYAYQINSSTSNIEVDYVRNSNVFSINIPADNLNVGTYDLRLTYNKTDADIKGGVGSYAIDEHEAFQIVKHTEAEDAAGTDITGEVIYYHDSFVYIASASSVLGADFTYPANISQDYLAILNSTTEIPEPSVTDFEGLWFSKIDAYRAAQIGGYTGTQEQLFLELASVQGLPEIIEDAIAATTAANNAAILADEKAGLADQKATEANNAANSANGAAMAANQATNNAIEATESISETEQTVQANEALRVEAEGDATKGRVKAENDRVAAEIARNVVSNIYNVTLAVPLTAGQYYTSTTARAAVPSGVRKRGLELVYETSAGVWYCERFIGASVATWTTSTDWEIVPNKKYVDDADALKVNKSDIANNLTTTEAGKVLDARQGKTLDDKITTSITDEKNIVPSIAFFKRVIADGGTIGDKTILAKLFTDKLKSLATTQVLFMPHLGMKERTSDVNKFASKVYDAGLSNLDAVQATEATQPYIGGFIAPNSLKGLKYCQGQTQTGEVAFTEKSYLATDSWSLTVVLKTNKRSARILLGANSYLEIGASTITLHNGTAAILTATYYYDCGKTTIIGFHYANGLGLIKVDGVPLTTTVTSGAISFSKLAYSSAYPFDGLIYYFHLQNERISEAESQQNYTLLRALFPEIEGIAIGNQFWASSNFEGTVAGDGTVIPEVQDNAAWAALTSPAWCYYNNSAANGAVYGKLYNWYAVELFSKYPPKGWRVPSKNDFDQLVGVEGGASVAGGKIKKEGYIFWQSPNLGADNQSGFSAIGSGYRVEGANFAGIRTEGAFWTNDKYRSYIEINAANIVFSNVSAYLHRGFSLRLLRNSPVGDSRKQVESGYFTTDIASAAKSIAIPFGYVVKEIRITTTTSVTAIEAKLHNTAGTAVATLITGKACNATSTTFVVTADQPTQLTDPTIRVTAAGNNATSIGMNITVIIEKIEL